MNTLDTSLAKTVTVLVPNGSMRGKMLAFLREQGFVPLDEEVVSRSLDIGKYVEGSLGLWKKNGEVVEVILKDRRQIPEALLDENDYRIAIGLTCDDMILNTWLCLSAKGKEVGQNLEDAFRMAPLTVTSGRNGGDARWALLVPKEQLSDGRIFPESKEITVLSELPLLALSLAKNLDQETQDRIGDIVEIQGEEEKRVVDANSAGMDTAAICIVESGKSAEEKGLAVIELARVQTKLAISERVAALNPVRMRDIEQLFNLPSGCLVLWPDFQKRGGLITVVMQDEKTGQILMVASANEEAYRATLATGVATFWSTSRNELWVKGATSGNVFDVEKVLMDCDGDAIIYCVQPRTSDAVACHTGEQSCFYRTAMETTLRANDSVGAVEESQKDS